MKKKITLKIAAKIGLGFGILTLALVLNAVLISRVITESGDLNRKISDVYEPSETKLVKLHNLVSNSHMLLRNWVFVDKIANTPDKRKLTELQNKDFPALRKEIALIADEWDDNSRTNFSRISGLIKDTLFVMQQSIMNQLNSIENYNDPGVMFMIAPSVGEDGEITLLTNKTLQFLDNLIAHQKNEVQNARHQMETSFSNLKRYIFITSAILILASLFLGLITVRSLVVPINNIKNRLLSMSQGILPEKKMKERNDEIGQMAKALNELVAGLKAISGFALEIGRGNYKSHFTPLSENDVLGNSLLRMRDDLNAATIEESKRKEEDQQRNWAAIGIAKFSEILRQDNDKLDLLSYHVISNLVKYMEANQGGIFLINDTDDTKPFAELVSCYAFNRKKHLEKRVEIGEGLVGRCILEKATIYLSDIPDGYIKITSGMGESNPRNLVLVPLMMNDEVFGV
ncbi:MAG: GAF domain-containing protein, partial [Candidatus Babeliaceae bacterium]|nr:GAF domain-containing protein [Candidatus Babeliaceae bacterium]